MPRTLFEYVADLMDLNYIPLATMILVFALLVIVMSNMAARRGLSRAPFIVLAFVPIVNIAALVGLALKRKQNQTNT